MTSYASLPTSDLADLQEMDSESTKETNVPFDLPSGRAIFSDTPSNNEELRTSIYDQKAPSTSLLSRWTELKRSRPSSTVEVLAEWNGCVTSIQSQGYSFSATLEGVIGEGVKGEREDATIPLADVSEWDNDLLRPGNFFRLCVVHEILNGQPRRFTQVVFRRLPAYQQHDLDRAAERGRELSRGLRVE